MDPVYLVAILPVFFIGMWLAATSSLGIFSGWKELQDQFEDRSEPARLKLHFQSGALGKGSHWNPLGNVQFGNCLRIEVCDSGLRVAIARIFGPFLRPFFVPWDQIKAERTQALMLRYCRLELGNAARILTLRLRTAERIAQAAGANSNCHPASRHARVKLGEGGGEGEPMSRAVHVLKSDIDTVTLVDVVEAYLPEGAIRLAIESFSVTANNVTYAVAGDSFRYWDFFPAPEGMGIVPMWGHARVIESKCPDITVGERVYGYLPMASHLDVVPGKITPHGFVDMAEHRQPMSPIYNQYSRLAADPEHDPAREGERMIFGPLFKTGFLIEYFMRGESWFGAGQVLLTSASSKTALGLAAVAQQNSPGTRRIGLTSAGNVDFVKSTGLYDTVLAYDELGSLDAEPAVSVDFAGNGGLLAQIHHHFGDALKYSCLVGATHVDARGGALGGGEALPGPQPTLFFAPDHAQALFRELGPQAAGQALAASWHHFLKAVDGTVRIERRKGLEAAREAYLATLAGTVDPAIGIVIEP